MDKVFDIAPISMQQDNREAVKIGACADRQHRQFSGIGRECDIEVRDTAHVPVAGRGKRPDLDLRSATGEDAEGFVEGAKFSRCRGEHNGRGCRQWR